jgi:hypothetical protein
MNKGISSISYDQFGNLFKVTFGNKSSIEYVYSADGVKLKARHITAIPQGTGSSSSSTNYIMSKDSIDYIVLYTKKSVELRTLMNIIKTRGYRRVS